jgi:hypothetical protein
MKKLFLVLFLLPLFVSGQTLNLNNNQVKLGGDTAVVIDGNLKVDTVFGYVTAPQKYQSYVALLNQSNTDAPTAFILENTTGCTISFAYVGVGTYYINSNCSTFVQNKTAVFTGDLINNTVSHDISISVTNPTQLIMKVYDGTNKGVDNYLLNTAIEIRVYP